VISNSEIVWRVLIAAGLSGAIGLERELRDHAAGLRTHILVGVGSALFTLVSAYGFSEFAAQSSTSAVRADVTRIASQVVVGIGFLGGGAIIRQGTTIRGLTTAASLWVTAAAGMAVGAGFEFGALVAIGVSLIVLAILKPVEKRILRGRPRESDD
jgi:putative Mg2+ transporter-C (MgtC) family protein